MHIPALRPLRVKEGKINLKPMKKTVFIRLLALFVAVISSVLLIDTVESQTTEPTGDNCRPRGIRLTVVDDPRHSVVVTWYTQAPAPAPLVAYSEKSDLSQVKAEKPIVKLVVLILIVKIIDLIFNFYRIRRKKHRYQF
jgi:hypothetical protein